MTDLTPITALGGSAPAVQQFGSLRIFENPDVALASLALRRDADQPAPMGLELPGPGKWSEGQGVGAFWTGPDQWMFEAGGAAVAVEAPGCSVTEQTDAWTVFEIASDNGDGPIHAMMEKLVNLDARAFVPGSATRTGLHHMSVFVIRRTGDRLAIIGMRSLAGALWHALEEAAKCLKGDLE